MDAINRSAARQSENLLLSPTEYNVGRTECCERVPCICDVRATTFKIGSKWGGYLSRPNFSFLNRYFARSTRTINVIINRLYSLKYSIFDVGE